MEETSRLAQVSNGSLPEREAAHTEWREFPACTSWSDLSPGDAECGQQLWMVLSSQQPCAVGSWHLWGQSLQYPWSEVGYGSCWGVREGGASPTPTLARANPPRGQTPRLALPEFLVQIHVPNTQWGQTNQNIGVWSYCRGASETNPTRNHEDAGSIPGLAQ